MKVYMLKVLLALLFIGIKAEEVKKKRIKAEDIKERWTPFLVYFPPFCY